jgi:hypothetical protein
MVAMSRRVWPASLVPLFVAMGLSLVVSSAGGSVAVAEKAPTTPPVTETTPYTDEFCAVMLILLNKEVAWVSEHTRELATDDPEMQGHVGQMWYYWSILEDKCGIEMFP